jgi:hypothetical protein
MADACLHAAGKSYDFLLHVQSVFNRRTGALIQHGCDCGGCIYPAEQGHVVRAEALTSPDRIRLSTNAVFSHLLTEDVVLKWLKLPQSTGSGDWISRLPG